MCCLSLWFPQQEKRKTGPGRKSTPTAPPRNYHPHSSPGKSKSSSKRKVIYFYDKHKPYYSFTNFADYPVRYMGHSYRTGEHLFQAMKFLDSYPDIAARIRNTQRPSDAFNMAATYQEYIDPNWYDTNINKMDEILRLKFAQHEGPRRELLDTGNAELIEDSPKDAFWGNGANKKGRNELGKALMRLRATLQEKERPVMRQIDSRPSGEKSRKASKN